MTCAHSRLFSRWILPLLLLLLLLLPAAALASDTFEVILSDGGSIFFDDLPNLFTEISNPLISQKYDGCTIRLNKDTTIDGDLNTQGFQISSFTMDFNGHTLKMSNSFGINNTAFTLTLTDSSTEGGGGITTTAPDLPCLYLQSDNITLNIESGTYQSNAAIIQSYGANTINITGGTLAGGRSTATIDKPRTIYSYGANTITIGGDAVITNARDACVALYGGDLTIRDSASLTGSGGVYLFNRYDNNATDNVHASLTMTGGSIVANDGFALTGNNTMSAGCSATITGGSLAAADTRAAIYWPMEGALTIGGDATVTGGTGIEAKMGTITIEGSATVAGTGAYKADFTPKEGGHVTEGSALLLSTQMYGDESNQYITSPNLTVNLSGGTLTSANGNAVTIYNTNTTNSQTATIRCEAGVRLSGGAQDTGGLFRFIVPASKSASFEIAPVSGSSYGVLESVNTSLLYGSGMAAAVFTSSQGDKFDEFTVYPSLAEALDAVKDATGKIIIRVWPFPGYEGSVIDLPQGLSANVTLYVLTSLGNVTVRSSGGDILRTGKESTGDSYYSVAANPPRLVAPDVTVTREGGDYVLSVSPNLPSGASLNTYYCRWYKDGVPVGGIDSFKESTRTFTPTDSGNYTVDVWALVDSNFLTFLTPVARCVAPAPTLPQTGDATPLALLALLASLSLAALALRRRRHG